MNRDRALLLLIGLLAGFLVGCHANEQVAGVQPARVALGDVQTTARPQPGNAGAAGAPDGRDPRMAESERWRAVAPGNPDLQRLAEELKRLREAGG